MPPNNVLLLFLLALFACQAFTASPIEFLSAESVFLDFQDTNGTIDESDHVPGNPLRFILYYANIYGKWSDSSAISQGNYFIQDTGFAAVLGSSDDTDTDSLTDVTSSSESDDPYVDVISDSDNVDYSEEDFLLTLFDGMATNKNSIVLSMNFASMSYNESNGTFSGIQQITSVLAGDQSSGKSGCAANVTIYFINISTNSPMISQPHEALHETGVQFIISSSACSIDLTTTVMTITSFADDAIPFYIILMSIAGLISAYSAHSMAKNFPDNVEELKSMSAWGLWITTAWELFLAVFHVYVAVRYFRFWILIVSFIYFFTMSTLRRINQLILIISRIERRDTQPLNVRMFTALVPVLILSASYCVAVFIPKVSFLVLTGGVYMVPQIYRIYKKGERPRGYYWHNFGFSFSKVFFVAYYLLYPENLFNTLPNYPIGFTFVGLVILQILIILSQRHLPRFLFQIRKMMSQPKEGLVTDKNEECPICFELLVDETITDIKQREPIAQTPCDHRFHARCLEEWINLRGNCPLDRKILAYDDLMF